MATHVGTNFLRSEKARAVTVREADTTSKLMTARPLPENFHSLHEWEERLRAQSLSEIARVEDLACHMRALESAMNTIEHYARSWETDDQNKLTIQLLGVRLFDGAAASLKLLLSGYYQPAAAHARDLLETSFLLDYFRVDDTLIAVWRTAKERKQRDRFRPDVVRKTLDARDRFTGEKRAEQYRLLSIYAAHPNPQGFRILRRTPEGLALIGPFFELQALGAILAELVKIVTPAAHYFGYHFEPRLKIDYLVKIAFLQTGGEWLERFAGRPFDRTAVEELKALALLAPAGVASSAPPTEAP
jgi:hypothetical protein